MSSGGVNDAYAKRWEKRRERYGTNGFSHHPRWVRIPAAIRFWQHIMMDPNSGCWLWTAKLSKDGYGSFRISPTPDGNTRAHAFAYRLLVGEIPNGLVIDHLCRLRCCVNPRHMEPVSHRENIRRGNVGSNHRDKTHCPSGHPYSGDNLKFTRSGSRCCAECRRLYAKKYYWMKKNAAARS